jgi:metallo-beta-lactamase family protein
VARPLGYGGAALDLGGVRVSLREAGHIIGSASVELVSDESRVILSGDLGRPGSPILRDPCMTWDEARRVDLVIMESTYGDRDHHQSHGDIARELEEIVLRAMQTRGHILVPAFAIGRTQTLLYHLNALVEAGRIRGLPVAVDTPLGLEVTGVYERFRALHDEESTARARRGDALFDFRDLYAVRRGRESVRLRDVEGPMLIIAGSGMCTGGRIVGHLKEMLPETTTTLLFIGYQAAGTTGRAIQEAARRGAGRVRIDGEDVALRARVEVLAGLSAHADRSELTRWLGAVPQPQRVGLHHGERKAQQAFAEGARRG